MAEPSASPARERSQDGRGPDRWWVGLLAGLLGWLLGAISATPDGTAAVVLAGVNPAQGPQPMVFAG